MEQPIYWNSSGQSMREAVIILCGWATKKDNKITLLGKRIAKTSWKELSGAARNVLIYHGIKP